MEKSLSNLIYFHFLFQKYLNGYLSDLPYIIMHKEINSDIILLCCKNNNGDNVFN